MPLLKNLLNRKGELAKEELKKEREEINKLIENQSDIISNLSCPICKNTKFIKGTISTNGSYGGYVSNINISHIDYNEEYKDEVLMCSNCGYVLMFADFKTKTIRKF